nr:immunoglobulin light chain junction region [Macaca mulatta]
CLQTKNVPPWTF